MVGGLFGGAPASPPADAAASPPADAAASRAAAPGDDDAFNEAAAAIAEETPSFAAHAAAFHEAPVTPELSALEIIPLDGIRDRKVKARSSRRRQARASCA